MINPLIYNQLMQLENKLNYRAISLSLQFIHHLLGKGITLELSLTP